MNALHVGSSLHFLTSTLCSSITNAESRLNLSLKKETAPAYLPQKIFVGTKSHVATCSVFGRDSVFEMFGSVCPLGQRVILGQSIGITRDRSSGSTETFRTPW
eukprot:scaffold3084_cov144-Cylindrotheca_fusiformis.AAC.66